MATMSITRRARLSLLLLAIAFIFFTYFNSASERTQADPFYRSTSAALAQREAEEKDGKGLESDDAALQRSLREAADKAKEAADRKGEEFHGREVKKAAEKANVAEDVKEDFEEAKEAEKVEIKNKDIVMPQTQKNSEKFLAEEREKQDKAEKAAKADELKKVLNAILKKSPSQSP
jgi:hypothetical protein